MIDSLTVYSKPSCAFCDRAKAWLDKNNIPYNAVDITQDTAAMDFIRSAGHKTVPQIYLGEQLLVEGGYTGLTSWKPSQLMEAIHAGRA